MISSNYQQNLLIKFNECVVICCFSTCHNALSSNLGALGQISFKYESVYIFDYCLEFGFVFSVSLIQWSFWVIKIIFSKKNERKSILIILNAKS